MHNSGYKSALARRACRYSDARPPRKTDGVLLESEIPPRMRGKWYVEVIDVHVARITPAYARKSETAADHSTAGSGSPPHMQGKEMPKGLVHRAAGIIPAYAGKRTPCRNTSLRYWDHPRVCGEKPNRILWEHWKEGSPPRMRGKVSSIDEVFVSQGITPAYAGKSR